MADDLALWLERLGLGKYAEILAATQRTLYWSNNRPRAASTC
jgi:hypothetical protein